MGMVLELSIHGVQKLGQERLLSRGSFGRKALSKGNREVREERGDRVAHSKLLNSNPDTANRVVINRFETTLNKCLRVGSDEVLITLIRANSQGLGWGLGQEDQKFIITYCGSASSTGFTGTHYKRGGSKRFEGTTTLMIMVES